MLKVLFSLFSSKFHLDHDDAARTLPVSRRLNPIGPLEPTLQYIEDRRIFGV